MKKKLLLVAALIFSSYARAQQDSAVKSLDEIIITANRIEQKQSQTGKVITVIGKETLNKSQGKSLAQVLNEQAGITVNGALNNPGTVQTVYMRGANSGRVLIMIDGMPINDPSQINNEFDLNLIQLNEVERIEIARGAQSTLYGSDAVTGVINIITTKTDIKKPVNIKAGVTSGNLGIFRSNVQVFGKANKLEYQLKTAQFRANGFSTAQDEKQTGQFDQDGFNGKNISASLKYHIAPDLSIRGFIQNNDYKTDLDNGAFTDDKDFTQKSTNLNTGGSINWKNKIVNLTANFMYSQSRRNFLDDSTSIGGFSKFVKDDYYSQSRFGEIFASFNIHPQLVLLTGYDMRISSFNNQFLSISSFGPFNSEFKDTSIRQESLYASLIFNSADKKFNMELGGRINVNSKYGSNYTYTLNPSYHISKNIQVFGSIATGFKVPSLFQLYSGFAGNDRLRPEESINYEGGVGYTGKQLRHRFVFFHRKVNRGIDFDYVNFKYYNIPNQRANGLEYEIAWQPFKNIDVNANATWIGGQEFVQSRITTKDSSYAYLLRRPALQANLQLGYRFKEAWYFSVSARYVSARYDVGGFQMPDVRLNDYFIANAYLSYTKKYGKIFIDLQNFTNTVFYDIRGFNSIPMIAQAGLQLEW
ncbi:MAG: TonB-dependent receptor [Bacteroidetes bacterium]|nr:TonB-dependent receptor [Bacteroidota bacterium]